MLEIDCSELPDELWFDVLDEFKNDFPEQKDVNILRQSKLIIVNKDSKHLRGQVIQSMTHHISDQVTNFSEYDREKQIELIESGYEIREL